MTEPRTLAISDLWHPHRWTSRLVGSIFAFTQLLMAWAAIAETDDRLGTAIAYLCFAAALLLLTIGRAQFLPTASAITVVALVVAVTLLQAQYGFAVDGRYADWYLGASIFALMGLMLWGWVWLSWLGFALLVLVQLLWSASQGFGIEVTGPILLRHLSTLVVVAFVTASFRRITARLTALNRQRQQRITADAVRDAVEHERDRMFARVDALSGHMLRRIADGTPLTDAERTECLLIEATLRDAMSGYGFASDAVLVAARAARERGVRVTLLDDSRGTHPQRELARQQLVLELAELSGGACTARMLDVDRELVASILIEPEVGEGRVVEVRGE